MFAVFERELNVLYKQYNHTLIYYAKNKRQRS